jgi:GH18 family chitinase
MAIGYYESWNWDRPCLHRRMQDIHTNIYTHLHWAFGTVKTDFTVTINDTYDQFRTSHNYQMSRKSFLSVVGATRLPQLHTIYYGKR